MLSKWKTGLLSKPNNLPKSIDFFCFVFIFEKFIKCALIFGFGFGTYLKYYWSQGLTWLTWLDWQLDPNPIGIFFAFYLLCLKNSKKCLIYQLSPYIEFS